MQFGFDVLKDFIREFSFFSSFVALLVGVILVVSLGHRGVFKRSFLPYRIFTSLYYLYIPLSFFVVMSMHTGITVFESSLLASVERSRERLIDESLQFTDFAIRAVRHDVLGQGQIQLQELRSSFIDTFFQSSTYNRPSDQFASTFFMNPEYAISAVHDKVQADLATAIADKMQDGLASSAPLDGRLPAVDVEQFLKKNFRARMEDGLAVELLSVLVKKRIRQLYDACMTYWFLALCFPFAESFVYAMYVRRRKHLARQ